eukprot:4989286-Pyramimonas_sp.AAC.1
MPRCAPAALAFVGRWAQTNGVRPWTAQQRSVAAMGSESRGRPPRRRSRVSRADRPLKDHFKKVVHDKNVTGLDE